MYIDQTQESQRASSLIANEYSLEAAIKPQLVLFTFLLVVMEQYEIQRVN